MPYHLFTELWERPAPYAPNYSNIISLMYRIKTEVSEAQSGFLINRNCNRCVVVEVKCKKYTIKVISTISIQYT